MPRIEVEWFAGRMEEKLQANDHKDGWAYCSARWLLNRLRQETGELQRAIEAGDSNRIIAEASDVANFAMMIADNAREHEIALGHIADGTSAAVEKQGGHLRLFQHEYKPCDGECDNHGCHHVENGVACGWPPDQHAMEYVCSSCGAVADHRSKL